VNQVNECWIFKWLNPGTFERYREFMNGSDEKQHVLLVPRLHLAVHPMRWSKKIIDKKASGCEFFGPITLPLRIYVVVAWLSNTGGRKNYGVGGAHDRVHEMIRGLNWQMFCNF
jgi:hypothetical protein